MVSGVNGIVVYRPSIDGYHIILQESINPPSTVHRPSSIIHHRRCSLFSKRDYLEIDEESKIVMTSWIEDLRFEIVWTKQKKKKRRRKEDPKRLSSPSQAKTQRIAT